MPDLARHMRVWRHGMIRELVGDGRGRGRIWTWEKCLFPTIHPLIPVLDRVSTSKHSTEPGEHAQKVARRVFIGNELVLWSAAICARPLSYPIHSRLLRAFLPLLISRASCERRAQPIRVYILHSSLPLSCSGSCLTTRRTWRRKNPQ